MTLVARVGSGEYSVGLCVGGLPGTYGAMIQDTNLHDDFGVEGHAGTSFVVWVEHESSRWPELVVAQRFGPGPEAGFYPGVWLTPESHVLFVGAGTRLLGYALRGGARRLWEDEADMGFWMWRQHTDVVVMSAELELAAWTHDGNKLWSIFVEPPWDYDVVDSQLNLDVMGAKSSFDLREGPMSGAAR